ncbi:MAG: anhydro-N-acetylmuramic acid kinase [gamma proteobacterium symbiont of Bathyaustriella thionipta]|nr:anhydro-N-acetylmuramic acid kinase [gamma proteobacterium symbiont of Bathyaustriella thionipta]
MPAAATEGLFIGLLSGTSHDAIDAALLEIKGHHFRLLAHRSHALSDSLQERIERLSLGLDNDIRQMMNLDVLLARSFASAANHLIRQAGVNADDIDAIGSHGQTLLHQPQSDTPWSLQIGDPNIIAENTGITTVADFRRRDLAAGGQGAPLTPAFHHWAFSSDDRNIAVVNIGGISNLSWLENSSRPAIGFDCGPGNTLLDAWNRQHRQTSYDHNGEWAASGTSHAPLLQSCLQDSFFRQAAPKSSGPDYFNLQWLNKHLKALQAALSPADVQATLAELTAVSIHRAMIDNHLDAEHIYFCGGGVHNRHLMSLLAQQCAPVAVSTTAALGLHPDWVEAAAFAWLASRTLAQRSGNPPAATGAAHEVVLGGVYYGATRP